LVVEYDRTPPAASRFSHGAGMNPELKRKADDLTTRLTYLRDSL
jgi:hypothetical protein